MKRTARMLMTGGKRWAWVRAIGAVAATLAACAPAQAFYWHDWPGSRVTPPPTLLTTSTMRMPPRQTSTANPPTVTPPQTIPLPEPGSPRTPPPPVGPPIGGDRPPVGPNQTPEPATALLGAIGLGALAAVRGWRKRK